MRNAKFGLSLAVVLICGSWLTAQESQPSESPEIQAAIDAGEFKKAQHLIEQIPQRDPWLGQLAAAQMRSGDSSAAKSSLRGITDIGQLARASQNVAASNDPQGGATGADFDSLINLITTTVEPDSWDDVGGPGSILPFPSGVEVDAKGVLRKRRSKRTKSASKSLDETLNIARAKAKTGNATDVHRQSKLRMVSLPRLEREMLLRVAVGEEPTEAMRHLAGIYDLRYVFIFPEENDIVIAGPADSWSANELGQPVTEAGKPVLLLEDLIALLRNAREQKGKFGCSIDPKQKALARTQDFLRRPTGTLSPSGTRRWVKQIRDHLGLQNVRVFGVDPSSHVARVIVEADYHMKLVGMGLEPSPGEMTSYLDSITADNIPKSMDVLRWWFTIQADPIEQNDAGNAFRFSKSTVLLQSENERLAANGKRRHTGSASDLNQSFAHRFTQNYEQLCREYPIYSELQNVFRLSLLAGLLQTSDVKSQVTWDADWFLTGVKLSKGQRPKEVPSIVNHRVINRKHVIVGVSGGVTVNVAQHVREPRLVRDASKLKYVKDRAVQELEPGTWWWD